MAAALRPLIGAPRFACVRASPALRSSSAAGALAAAAASLAPRQSTSRGSWQHTLYRTFYTTPVVPHGGKGRPKPGEGVTLHFKKADGEIVTVEANEGDDIVDVSWEYDLDIEAACEKSVACSTCHVILEEDLYDKLEEPDDDENVQPNSVSPSSGSNECSPAGRFGLTVLWFLVGENPQDMLDLAFGLTDTSRLGCQVKVTKDFEGTTITLPSATRNLRVDGSKPTHH